MFKKKLKNCKKCNRLSVIWKDGKCQSCCSTGFKNPTSTFNKSSTNKHKEKIKDFFESLYNTYKNNAISFESGKRIGNLSNMNFAHIFPKQIYKSIAYNPKNILLLTWEEHTRFDELLWKHDFDKLEQEFKSWLKICERLKEVIPLCEEEGKLKLALTKYITEKQ